MKANILRIFTAVILVSVLAFTVTINCYAYDPLVDPFDRNYNARNDQDLWMFTPLSATQTMDILLDVTMEETTYDDTGKESIDYDVFNFAFSSAAIELKEWNGQQYFSYTWYNLGDTIKYDYNVTSKMYLNFDFTLRFDGIQAAQVKGYSICRLIDLLINFNVGPSPSSSPWPMYNYQINLVTPTGELYNLYYSNFVSSFDAGAVDIDLDYDGNFTWIPGSEFQVSFQVYPFDGNYQGGSIPSTTYARMNLYRNGRLGFESPTVSNTINSEVLDIRSQYLIDFQDSALDDFQNQLDNLQDFDIPSIDSSVLDDIDSSVFAAAIDKDSTFYQSFSTVLVVCSFIALVGYLFVGKKA